jgi:putative peptidoglycan lipid II flippase
MVFLLTLPSSVGLVVLGRSIIGAIYQGGKFQVYDTHQTATALSCYAIGLVGYAGLKVLTPAFYALDDARTPMIVGVLSILINYFTAVTLIRGAGFGHASLALSTSAVAIFGFVVLFALLRARLGGVYGRELAVGFAKVGVASAAMGCAVFVASRQMEGWLGVTQMARRADLAVSIPLGVAVFYFVCRAMGVTDLDMAFQAVLAPVRRRLRRR